MISLIEIYNLSCNFIANAQYIPAKLPWWWLSANYYLRESFAVVNDQVVRPLLA